MLQNAKPQRSQIVRIRKSESTTEKEIANIKIEYRTGQRNKEEKRERDTSRLLH